MGNSSLEVRNWEVDKVILLATEAAKQLGKMFGADFKGHEEEALEFLMQIDACRQIRRMEPSSEIRRAKFKGTNELKNLITFDVKFKASEARSAGKGGAQPADIVCLQETKPQGDIQEIVKQIWGGRWVRYACLEASGTRGGIIMLWDSRVWKREVQQIGVHTLTYSFEGLLQNFNSHITGCTHQNCNVERRERNCQRRSTTIAEFSDFIEDLELIDLPLEGGTHTWFKGDTNNVASRIGRIIFTTEWGVTF
ncbi:hypothetical protein H5410_021441 [Solanum commersonii]|uniref:Uncharacterized protein n=1 Tax=Solanum commersonii TaxID=4109 RepID=A0A9J5ZE99_SOLCO|nr:hypothetical protein H5410_021441 [Solanum commersonii]